MTASSTSVSPFHWSKLMRTAQVKEIFQSLLARAEEVEWEGCKVSRISNISREFNKNYDYCYRMFVRVHRLLVLADKPGEYFIFQDQQEADEFRKLLAAGKFQIVGTKKVDLAPKEMSQSDAATPRIIGKSEKIKKVLRLTELVAKSTTTVLFFGESGTGKELFARTIHALSPRREGPFVAINCSAIPEALIESELFGHEKGAFTDAKSAKPGKFELAEGGTLFLDEIGELPLLLQAKVLRFLQERTLERVGGVKLWKVDVRIVAATSSNLIRALNERRFREDLYYRLNVFPITIPPLRDRLEDAPLLLEYFLANFCASKSIKIPAITNEVGLAIMTHSWPGNVRELENLVERALIHSQKRGTLRLEDFTLNGTVSCLDAKVDDSSSGEKPKFPSSLRELEIFAIQKALQETSWHKLRTAKILDITPRTLYNKIKKYGLSRV